MKFKTTAVGIISASLMAMAATAAIQAIREKTPPPEATPISTMTAEPRHADALTARQATRAAAELIDENHIEGLSAKELSDDAPVWSIGTAPYKAPRISGATAAATPQQLEGWYLEYDSVLTQNGAQLYRYVAQLAVSSAPDKGNVHVVTMSGVPFTDCYATLDGSKLTIPAGKYCPVSNSSGQTVLALCCPLDVVNMKFYPNKPIEGVVKADGSIELPSWGIFVVDESGQNASVVQANINTRMEKANAMMSGVNYSDGKTRQWPVLVKQTHANRLTVENFGNTGAPVFVDIDYTGHIEVAPQYMGMTQYGEVDCMALNASGTGQPDVLMETQISGTNEISLPDWGVLACSDPSKYVFKLKESKLTLNDPQSLSLPARQPVNFDGGGTETSPYIIKSYAELMGLAQLVNVEKKNQEGVYYKLGSNIDCSNQNYYYTPIGKITASADYVNNANEVPGVPFAGHFDGGNYTISGIDYECGNRGGIGVFGWVSAQGSVSNLRVDRCTFLSEGIGTGAVVGHNQGLISKCESTSNQVLFTKYNGGGIAGGHRGVIEGCMSTSTLMGYGNMGGISGGATGTIRDCQARGSMTFFGIQNSMYPNAGGLTGTINGSWCQEGAPALIERCIAAVAITDRTSEGTTGGFIGSILCSTAKSPVQVRECLCITTMATNATYAQTGPTSYTSGRAGGFLGSLWRGQISDCVVTGVLMAPKDPKYVGALTGYIMSDKDTKVENFLSTCQVIVSNTTPKAQNAIYSEITSTYEKYLTNVYYDRQLVGLDYSSTNFKGNLTTAALTGAEGPAGFGDKWKFTAGLYPQLKTLADNGAMQVAASPIFLTGDETSRMVKSNFTMSTANNVRWSIMGSDGLGNTGQGLDINGANAILKNEYGRDILCAYVDGLPYLKQAIINTIPSKMFAGSGTEADPYQIKDINDLKNLQAATEQYNMTFEGVFFKVMNDIDCAGDTSFGGIAADGVTGHEFSGTFDGAGHVIDNVVINKVKYDATGKAQSSGSTQYAGFIGRLNAKGTIKNLTLGKGCRMTFWSNSGAISGFAAGRIENCVFQGSVDGMSTYIAGIAGALQSTGIVTGCRNDGTIRGGLNYVAGIVANNGNVVEYCLNNGTVIGDSINSYHKGGNANYIGGIVGNLASKTVKYCVNQGNIISSKAAGGIYGYSSTSPVVTGCINTGIVTSAPTADYGALGGGGTATSAKFTDNYYDGQTMPIGAIRRTTAEGCTALTTAQLCSTTLPAGLPTEAFDCAEGVYPVLKAHKDAASTTALRSMVITLPQGMTLADVTADAQLSSKATWSLLPGSADIYSIAGNTLKVGTPADKEIKIGTLTATIGDWSRSFTLKTVPPMFDGQGTAEVPYLIHNKAEWNRLAEIVNTQGVGYNGKYFRLTADLDFEGDTVFLQIGANGAAFGGIFNGDNHSILNLKVKHLPSMALFGTLSEGGAIRNLTLKGGEFSSPKSGAVTGFVSTSNGTVENCVNYNKMNAGPTTSASYAAGIAYTLLGKGQILNCRNYGEIDGKSGTSGGIVCIAERGSLVSGCRNEGKIAVNSTQVGGIAGKCSGTLRECENLTDLTAPKGSQIGGITGYTLDSCRLEKCTNRGNITMQGSTNKGGGLVGYANGFTYIYDSANHGAVKSTSTSTTGYIGGIAGQGVKLSMYRTSNYADVECANGQYTGGLAGTLEMSGSGNVGHVDSCFNYGSVKGGNKYIGGLYGRQSGDYETRNSGNHGSVTGTGAKAQSDNTAGIAGYAAGDFFNCYNAGDVTSKGILVSGFLSEGSGNIINDSFNIGTVTSTATNATATKPAAAGFWATGRSENLKNSYNAGAVSGKNFVSGFIGNFSTKVNISGCYAAAPVTVTDESGTAAPFLLSTPSGENSYADNYYDNTLCTATGGYAEAATGKSTKEMLDFAPNAAYQATPDCYPTLKSMAKCIPGNFAAAQLCFKTDEENLSNVLNDMTIGLLEGVVWTCSPEFKIENNKVVIVKSDAKGVQGWIQKQGGELSYRYNLVINVDTGIAGIEGSDIADREYYTPDGLRVQKPRPGQIVVVKTIYTDGKVTVQRVAYGR